MARASERIAFIHCAVTLKGSGNNRKLTRVGGLTLPGVFTREKVNPFAG